MHHVLDQLQPGRLEAFRNVTDIRCFVVIFARRRTGWRDRRCTPARTRPASGRVISASQAGPEAKKLAFRWIFGLSARPRLPGISPRSRANRESPATFSNGHRPPDSPERPSGSTRHGFSPPAGSGRRCPPHPAAGVEADLERPPSGCDLSLHGVGEDDEPAHQTVGPGQRGRRSAGRRVLGGRDHQHPAAPQRTAGSAAKRRCSSARASPAP